MLWQRARLSWWHLQSFCLVQYAISALFATLISKVLLWCRVQTWSAISGYTDIKGKNRLCRPWYWCNVGIYADYTDIEDLWISYAFCLSRYRLWYAIPGAAGSTGHIPAPGQLKGLVWTVCNRVWLSSRPFLLLDTPHSARCGVQLPSAAAVALLWHASGLPAWPAWSPVIVIPVIWWWSTWRQSSMLSAFHW